MRDAGRRRDSVLVCGILAIGCALRLAQYVANRSVSIDESYLALNLIDRSIGSLLGPLDFNQAAPVGFLAIQRLIGVTLGFGEPALRLAPLVASLAALFAFWPLARALLGRGDATFALAAFAVADPMIFYGSIGKQYSVDVAVTVVLLLLARRLDVGRDRRAAAFLATSGVLATWLSFPAAFVLTTIGGLGVAESALRRRFLVTRRWFLCCLVWAGSFTCHYLVVRDNVGRIQTSFRASESAYLGTSESLSTEGGSDTVRDLLDRVQYLVGLEHTSSGEPAVTAEVLGIRVQDVLVVWLLTLVLLGLVGFFRRSPSRAALVVGPGLLAGLASAIGSYPLVGRTLLFAIPLVCLALGSGASVLAAVISSEGRRPTAALAALALSPLLILPAQSVVTPRVNQGMLDALQTLDRARRPEDALFVAHQAQYTLAYYLRCDCRELGLKDAWPFARGPGGTAQRASAMRSALSTTLAVASDDVQLAMAELRSLAPARVWLLFADTRSDDRLAILREARRAGDVELVRAADAPARTRAELYLLTRRTGDNSL